MAKVKALSTVELVSSLVSLIKGLSLALIAVTIEWGERRRRYAEAEQAKAESELRAERMKNEVDAKTPLNSKDTIRNFLLR